MLFLLPVLVIPFLVAAVQFGRAASRNIGLAVVVSVLKVPFALFAERSPGGRGSGELFSTKPDSVLDGRALTAAGKRNPAIGLLSPFTTEDLMAISGNLLDGYGTRTESAVGVTTSSPPSVNSDTVPREIADIFNRNLPLESSATSETPRFDIISPIDLLASVSTDDQALTPPPLDFPAISSGPVILGIPEPSSWAVMLAGFLVMGTAMRRRRLGQSALMGLR